MSVTRVVLGKLSPTMEEGTVVKWTKQEGDAVKVGDVLAEIETDKANMEMEALGAGVLRKVLVPAGGKAPVGALIGVIAGKDEDIGPLLAEAAAAAAAAPPPSAKAEPEPAAPPPQPETAAPPEPAPSPASRPQAAAPAGTAAAGSRVKASPLARAIAAERNIPLAAISGSGPGGRVIRRDVETWSDAPASHGAPPAAPRRPRPAPSVTPGQRLPLSNMRKTIARRLAESKFTAPHFYVSVEVDMDAAADLRAQLERAGAPKVSYNDLVVKASALALRAFPMVNSSWTSEAIVTHGEVHVGVAVSIPDGLITPVVRDADQKSVTEISGEIKELAGRAREKRLRPEEFAGSTFTVSNLGMFEVSAFTAIINPPESAILAVGAVRKLPVVAGDAIRVGQRMSLTLSADHRVVDGALAAQFLAELRRLLEAPIALFL
jgi:pyruvate dehydrogenase E2 component (dihydrolipoyllysine-residue acetyltransferase)